MTYSSEKRGGGSPRFRNRREKATARLAVDATTTLFQTVVHWPLCTARLATSLLLSHTVNSCVSPPAVTSRYTRAKVAPLVENGTDRIDATLLPPCVVTCSASPP